MQQKKGEKHIMRKHGMCIQIDVVAPWKQKKLSNITKSI